MSAQLVVNLMQIQLRTETDPRTLGLLADNYN